MFSPLFTVLLFPLLAAMFLAVNMGGSGTAPAFAAAYGSKIIRKDLIPGLFGVFVFLGAILAGKKVVLTVSKGILPASTMGLSLTTCVLLAVGLTLLLANLLKIPQSTSQATVFALVAPAVYFDVLKTRKLFMEMIPAWFFLPVVSFFTLYVVGRFVYGPLKRRFRWDTAAISGHPALKWTVVLVACYVAFAIGSNNVANAAGPIASMGATEMRIDPGDERFVLLMLFSALVVAPCFGIGSSLLGARVMETTGKKIVEFGPLGAVLISILTASLLLVASVTRGIPMSLVQMNTAAILGLGVCKVGWRRVFAQTSVKKLLGVWIMAPVIAFSISMAFTFLADWAGLLQRG